LERNGTFLIGQRDGRAFVPSDEKKAIKIADAS